MLTRATAAAYYKNIASTMLPHLRNRPLSFKRWPDSIDGEFFWEKDAPSFTPAWVKRFPVPRREGGPPIEYIVANDARTLVWLASIGGFEIHAFLHRVPHIDIATHVVFDLDPGEGAGMRDCAKVALLLRDALPLESFAKVSGSKGIQVYVPMNERAVTHEVTEQFARTVAEELARRHPSLIVAKMAKALRRGKVFIDWSQNADYKTTVAVYSLRATGLVSMPVKWSELQRPRKLTWTPDEALARVRKLGDLWSAATPAAAGFEKSGHSHRRTPQLPKPSSQSGRRLFLVTKTETGNELWLDVRGRFKRFLLRPDRTGAKNLLIAMPAGDFAIEPDYRNAAVPARWRGRVTIDDSGSYEIIEGSWPRKQLRLWFAGKVMQGEWTLEKIEASDAHRSWRLSAAASRRATGSRSAAARHR